MKFNAGLHSSYMEVATILVQIQTIVGMLKKTAASERQPHGPGIQGLSFSLNMRSGDLQKVSVHVGSRHKVCERIPMIGHTVRVNDCWGMQ